MVTPNVCTKKRSCDCLVYAEFERFWSQYEIDLVVFLPGWSMPGRCSGRFVWVQRVGQCEWVASGELKNSWPMKSKKCDWSLLYQFCLLFMTSLGRRLVQPWRYHGCSRIGR
ncbi:hypothetical protein DPMN_163729 [Dreissena polymorpha]|uniref:Uncharacterized protein n=1 Tax=Dreissena polymorpha TaxID=45954 RepID=A0A9D4EWC8_DREPO|nr:hypothetical protein DPMN_163729 [Dreissena polymorpha]